MKKRLMPFWQAVGMGVVGIVLGTVFVVGMRFWNAPVERSACEVVETRFLDYKEIKGTKNVEIKEIAIDCANGQRYFIDGVSVDSYLIKSLSELQTQDSVILLIHPNSDNIVEFSANGTLLLSFDDTIKRLETEATGFVLLGFFMYFFALVGIGYIVAHLIKRKRRDDC